MLENNATLDQFKSDKTDDSGGAGLTGVVHSVAGVATSPPVFVPNEGVVLGADVVVVVLVVKKPLISSAQIVIIDGRAAWGNTAVLSENGHQIVTRQYY